MFKHFTRFLAIGVVALTTSCAGSYRAIRPDHISSYQSSAKPNALVEFSYEYGALAKQGGNKKYLKKERKQGYQVVAVKLKNNTQSNLIFGRDLELSFGDRPITPVPAAQAATDLKQGVAIYLLYILLNFQIGGTTTHNPYTGQTTTSGGTFLPTGPFIAAGNMIGAGTANKNLRKEFMAYDISNKTIAPGQTVYGIISLRESNVAPLYLKLRNQAAFTPASEPQTVPVAPVPAPATVPAGAGG